MVYTCQHCGAWFPRDMLKDAMTKNEKIIVCPYCDNINEMDHVKTSHVTKGYDCLEYGDFYAASMEFGEALKGASNLDISAKSSFLDAYLGRALSQYSVQVIYDEEIADESSVPEVNCYICNESFLEDSYDYQTALEIANRINDSELRRNAISRVTDFAKKVDGIKRVYDRKMRENDGYQLFIACEDTGKDAEAGLSVANKIRDNMPSLIKDIFVQDSYGLSFEEYEGSLLYAIHNSSCMLVVVDNDLDARLMNLYSRYYRAMTMEDVRKEKHLGFVRFKNKVQIHLPDHKISENVFELEDKSGYTEFVCNSNKVFIGGVKIVSRPDTVDEESTDSGPEEDFSASGLSDGAPVVQGRICRFGSYPQRRVTDERIHSFFLSEPKPTVSSANGWEAMFRTKSGQPYTWYKDKIIDGKKYRAVYFVKFREVFTIRHTDIAPSVQRVAQYTPMRIYVFAYEDIEWNILDISRNAATLVASVGLDCREFNNNGLSADWKFSSIRAWLNNDFYNVAFNNEEKDFLWRNSENDSVTLLEEELDFSNKHYRDKLNSYNITGSDYFRCIGGFCARHISNFWIKATVDQDDRAATVQPHCVTNIVPQYVDSTSVSVLPLVRVKIVD